MIHGLMWFPLLAVFMVLAWMGWNEYQKVEAYRGWATGADRAKYDIRAALIQKQRVLLWGKPSRSGVVSPQNVSLDTIETVNVQVDGVLVSLDSPPETGKIINLELIGSDQSARLIPFTDINLAVQWAVALRQDTGVSS